MSSFSELSGNVTGGKGLRSFFILGAEDAGRCSGAFIPPESIIASALSMTSTAFDITLSGRRSGISGGGGVLGSGLSFGSWKSNATGGISVKSSG